MIENNEQLFELLRSLVEAWCDRRSLHALRYFLQAYPMPSVLTDSWGELAIALENVRASARGELTEVELQSVNEAIWAIRKAMGGFQPVEQAIPGSTGS